MRFTVSHETLYRYSVQVGLAPHVLRLKPRPDAGRLLSSALLIDPVPAEWIDTVDDYGNGVTRVSFHGATTVLRIESRFELDTVAAPFPSAAGNGLLPLPWRGGYDDGLADYRLAPAGDPQVADFAHAVAAEAGEGAIAFLDHLGETLYSRIDRHIRIEGEAQSPGHTLASWRGACRDITVLFLAACRSMGMAARFVSGYQARPDTPNSRRHMHAWPEVFLPGTGWRGWDPTHGQRVGDGHVPLCAAPEQAATMPVEGGFYANGVTATLDYAVHIETS